MLQCVANLSYCFQEKLKAQPNSKGLDDPQSPDVKSVMSDEALIERNQQLGAVAADTVKVV